jgi:outer membrane immunogenic protein
MSRLGSGAALAAALIIWTAPVATAQEWTGAYVSGSVGAALLRGVDDESVRFDTDLDGDFGDTVRTAAGADAFSPGFCAGLAVNALPASGCGEDEGGLDAGGRVGYDWRVGRLVVGGLVDVSYMDASDGVSSFSTTPAFYSFARELNYVAALRGRIGTGTDRVLIYGTGGAAWASLDHLFTTSNGVNAFVPGKNTRRTEGSWGYQAGGGVEVRVGARWSLTGEYLFTSIDDRGEATVRSQGPAPATNPFVLVNPGGTDLQPARRFDVHGVRLSVGYRF